jgi:hypothetical protein
MADYSYIGSGKVYMRVAGASAGLVEVGNCSNLNFSISEEAKELKDYTQGGGGLYNSVRRISGVEVAMTLHDLNDDNLAVATFGTSSAIAAGSVSNEALGNVYPGAIGPTAFPINTTQTVTVTHTQSAAAARANTTAYALGDYILPAAANGYIYKATAAGTSAGSPPTYPTVVGDTVVDGTVTWTCVGKTTMVVNTDYTVSAAGITFLAAGISSGEPAQVSYTKAAGNAVEALLNSAQTYELFFAGLNEARSGKSVRVRAHKVTFGPAQNLSFIGEDYLALELSGKVSKDSTKNGTTVSQYFKADIVD